MFNNDLVKKFKKIIFCLIIFNEFKNSYIVVYFSENFEVLINLMIFNNFSRKIVYYYTIYHQQILSEIETS